MYVLVKDPIRLSIREGLAAGGIEIIMRIAYKSNRIISVMSVVNARRKRANQRVGWGGGLENENTQTEMQP